LKCSDGGREREKKKKSDEEKKERRFNVEGNKSGPFIQIASLPQIESHWLFLGFRPRIFFSSRLSPTRPATPTRPKVINYYKLESKRQSNESG
jgi:hypothetical protein